MSKQAIASVVLLLGVLFNSAVNAEEPAKNCSIVFAEKVNAEAAKKFLKETQSIRDDLIVKQLMLQQEHAKETPVENRSEALQWEIADLEHELEVAARKNGIPIDGMWGRTNSMTSSSGKKS
jgi:hypothetical protein